MKSSKWVIRKFLALVNGKPQPKQFYNSSTGKFGPLSEATRFEFKTEADALLEHKIKADDLTLVVVLIEEEENK